MDIRRNGSQPSATPPAAYFTGTVRLDMPFKGTGEARVAGATVTFEPGARTAWHTHPLGQPGMHGVGGDGLPAHGCTSVGCLSSSSLR